MFQYSRMNYLDIRLHFICDHVEKDNITLDCVSIESQLINIITNSLDEILFSMIKGELGVIDPFVKSLLH